MNRMGFSIAVVLAASRVGAINRVTPLETPKHGELVLVEGGKLRAAILAARKEEDAFVGPEGLKLRKDQKSVAQAVGVLCAGFRKACGQEPKVLEPDDKAREEWPVWIVVGKNAITDELGLKPYELPQEGFLVSTFKRGVVIAGMDGFRIPGAFDFYDFKSLRMNCNGTLWGAWDFLERVLDQRYYYPGYGGEVIPSLGKRFVVKPIAYWDAPKYWSRGYSLPGLGAYRAGNSARFFGGESPNPFDLQQAFPNLTNELFATMRGRFQCNSTVYGGNYLDITNPKFAETLAGAFRKYFETKGEYNPLWGERWIPNSEWCWFGQCDRRGLIENERTKDLIERNVNNENHLTATNFPREAMMSSVYAEFFDRFGRLMEEAAPGRKIACEVYSDWLYPPTKWKKKLPDNIRILMCYGTPPMVKSEAFRKAYRHVYEGWRNLTAGPLVPYVYSAGWRFLAGIQLSLQGWYMSDFLKEYADLFDEHAMYPCLCKWTKLFFPAMDLCARAVWNPDYDREGHVDEMWRRLYPHAGKTLKAFHDGVIEIWETKTMPGETVARVNSLAGPNYTNLYATFDEKWMRASLRQFDEARRAVTPGSPEGAAVEKFVRPWIDLIVSRLDGARQRMETNERPNLVPPTKEGDALAWSVWAWNRADRLDPDGASVGFAPCGASPATGAYLHGGVIRFRTARNMSTKKAVFAFEMKGEKYAVYANGRRLDTGVLAEDWTRVTVEAPPGALGAGVNALAVSNIAERADCDLSTGWLIVRHPTLRFAEAAAPTMADEEGGGISLDP